MIDSVANKKIKAASRKVLKDTKVYSLSCLFLDEINVHMFTSQGKERLAKKRLKI